MNEEIERICIDGVWLGIDGNTPWNIPGKIKEININTPDPRNMKGADSIFIVIVFDSGYTLDVKTNDYMALYKAVEVDG